ncbi:type I restriction endonuclease subunit R [Bifidobacterium magnum]|uniref:Type I restriction enzyme endonuclease subunit n=1 Tax=Bifidobacterium magnum TaxID=1692 RepID=A0A087BEB4_9BIFI|nr:HsdR family type I site-specific deoxyribonuclease [Bifidobacterium magnum]KFI69364.1 putative Type I restriction (R) subunit of unknown recognition sequence [Bifidobacterium magnum]
MRNELEFEDELIHYLESIGGTRQWEYRPDIKTFDALWQNFREILNRHNMDKLAGIPLTNSEFAQVKHVISNLHTPYEAGKWLYGLNGVTQVEIDRDKPNPGSSSTHVYLTVFDQDQIGAGNTVYQIVNQIKREDVRKGFRNARFDTTLLINGLPIIHIEEKYDGHDAFEALNQMHGYITSGAFSDIYSTVQILVGMTPHMARYMANTTADDFNTAFAFRWQREHDSKPVQDWKEFCNLMLSIPMAHQMATNYMILDSNPHHPKLMVMRPYQVYATRRVIDRLRTHTFGNGGDPRVGYIWHTTGSGKTISSFKTAWLASRLPNVDKVVFVVDRVALTNQTFESYQAYDPEGSLGANASIIADTRNTNELARRLQSKERSNSIIVTSIQKLDKLAKRAHFKALDANIVFIADEAHRSMNGDAMRRIRNAFPRGAWVGYTGTPAFDGNKTQEVFGDLLHAYTIREAIADRNVLGFKVDFQNTLPESEIKTELLPVLLKKKHSTWNEQDITNKIARMAPDEVDAYIDSGIYDDNKKHVQAVVDDIFKYWRNRSKQGKYKAMLTTHVGGGKASSHMALMYFDEFARRNKERQAEGKLPIHVAVTFSYSTDNSDDMVEKNTGLLRAIEAYNATFGTSFDLTTTDEYFDNVASRLRGELDDSETSLDLVIVIDQLLTGFDAKMVNTLYVDRTMSGASLIQAYSRTNRIDNFIDKPYGRIVNYRWPETSKQLMNAALSMYANRDSAGQGTLLPDYPEDAPVVDGKTYTDLVEEARTKLKDIRAMTNDFEEMPKSESAQETFMRTYAQYNGIISQIRQDDEFDYDKPEALLKEIGLTQENENKLIARAIDTKRAITERTDGEGAVNNMSLDLDFSVEHIAEINVNYDYINDLLAELMNRKHEGDDANIESAYQRASRAIDQMTDRQQAEQYQAVADTVFNGTFESQDLTYPIQGTDIPKIVREQTGKSRRRAIVEFKEKWGLVDVVTANKLLEAILRRHVAHQDDLNLGGELSELSKEAFQFYTEDAQEERIRKLSKIKYKVELKRAMSEFADYVVTHFQ